MTVVSSPEVAEMSKLFENTFRQVNIALVNELSQIANLLQIPTFEILAAAASKPFGFLTFVPSVGVGGNCIPVDPHYLQFAANKVGFQSALIDLADTINSGMPKYVADKILNLLGGSLEDKKIQVAGISYKSNVADTSESPAIILINALRQMGALVTWHDELVGEHEGEISKPLAFADLGVIVTHHDGVKYEVWKGAGVPVIDVSSSLVSEWPKLL